MRLCRRAPWRPPLQHRVPVLLLLEGHEQRKALCKSAFCFSFLLVLSLVLLCPNHSCHNRNIHPRLHQRPYSLHLRHHTHRVLISKLSHPVSGKGAQEKPGSADREGPSGYHWLRDAPTSWTPFLRTLGHCRFCLVEFFPGDHLAH